MKSLAQKTLLTFALCCSIITGVSGCSSMNSGSPEESCQCKDCGSEECKKCPHCKKTGCFGAKHSCSAH